MGMLSKFTACVLMAAVTVSCAADYSHIRTATKLVVESEFEIQENKGEYGFGSGVVIAPGYILTAKHVVAGSNQFLYAGSDGRHLKRGTVVKISDSPVDLALIHVPGVECPCVPLADDNPAIDDDIVDIGFPLYDQILTQYASRGSVQGFSGQSGYQMVMNVNIAPGNSGGGVYVKTLAGWRLAGIAVAVVNMKNGTFTSGQLMTWMSIAMSTRAIREFLKGTPAEQ